MTTGDRIKDLRKDAGYNRTLFAQKIGIPQTTLRNYENGEREPGHNFLITIAKEFNVTVDYLLGLDQKEKPATTEGNELDPVRRQFYEKIIKLDDHQFQIVSDIVDSVLRERDE